MTDYILPHDLERKITVLSEGLEKLRNDDIDGAMEELDSIVTRFLPIEQCT